MNTEPKFARVDTWAVTTPGALIGYIADEQDAAVAFVVRRKELFHDGTFIQMMQIIQIPNGHVLETIDRIPSFPEGLRNDKVLVSTTLTKLMEAGLVK